MKQALNSINEEVRNICNIYFNGYQVFKGAWVKLSSSTAQNILPYATMTTIAVSGLLQSIITLSY